MTGNRVGVAASLAEVLAGPVVRGASCRGLAPEWDAEIEGEAPADRDARVACAREVCRRCSGLARCLELLDELGQDRNSVLAGEVRGANGRVLAPRWTLRDALDPAGRT